MPGSLDARSGPKRSGVRRALALVAAAAVAASGISFFPGLAPVAPAHAEFAEGGEGSHRNSIDWFNFQQEGQTIPDGKSYTNVRTIGSDEIRSTCRISAISPVNGAVTYRPGAYAGDGLPHLYYQTAPATENTLVNALANQEYGGEVTFDFECSAEFVPGGTGTPIPVPLQGLVVADAESSSKDTDEYVHVTPQPTAGETVSWYAMDRWRPANCDSSVLMTPDAEGGMRFAPTGSECYNEVQHAWSGPMAVGFMKGATKATVKLKGGGHSAVALGMVMSTDFGDAPSTFVTDTGETIPLFGEAGAIFQPDWSGTLIAHQPVDVFGPSFQLASPTIPSLHLGGKIDAEIEHQSSWDALLDDETGESDEDGIPLTQLPQVAEGLPLNDTNSIDVLCSADSASGGWVAGWLDWNRNGKFDAEERSTPVECTGVDQTVTMHWPDLGALKATTSAFAPVVYLRVRIAETAEGLTPEGVLVPTGVGSAGEVEDYALGVPLIEAYKESTPISNVPQAAGDVVEYELTFRNVGQVEGPIVYRDFLGDVLDNATFNTGSAQASASAGSEITLTEPSGADQTLGIDGIMQPGETVTIRYSVTVSDPVVEDGRLRNFLLHVDDEGAPLEPLPTFCEPDNPRCTTHPLVFPKLDVQKTAIPGSGQAVEAGHDITYYLDFRNTGTAAVDVDYVDDLSKVLPFASIEDRNVMVIGEGLTATLDKTAQTVHITGSLPAGGYTRVTVVALLNEELPADLTEVANFLHETGTEPPGECLPESELCTTHPIDKPDLQIAKSADPETGTLVSAGDVLTYTLTFDNSNGAAAASVAHEDDLSGVLDDAAFGEVTDDGGLTVAGPTGGKLAISGSVPAGAVKTVTYTVTVKEAADRADSVLANFLLEAGGVPPGECLPEDPCTTHPAGDPQLVLTKTADPASGAPVVAGQTVTYTLGFDNTDGTAPATLDHTDDLSDVLDDATFVVDSLTAGSGLTATGPDGSGLISITGTVPAGEKATVTYQVTVKDPVADGAELANFLFAGDEKPETCEPNQPCTVHPGTKPELQVTKSADPASGTEVFADDELTYTLTFENTGSAPAAVAYTDDLSGVLDDAELIQDPTVTPAGALTGAIADGALAISGTLAPGAKATVTYQVRVLPQGERGDHSLGNFLFPTGTNPPTTCAPESELCTEHPAPLPDLTVTKLVDAGSTTPVAPGDELRYGLEFNNSSGKAPATVSYVDDLSGILDDASFDPASLEIPEGLSVDFSEADGTLTITGTVPAGQTLTVRYVATVLPDGERGDNELVNFLFEEGTEPPTVCTPEETCTTNPVPALVLTKTADPASGDPVAAGDTVSYTLTFDNRAGKAPAALQHTDDLSDVLDDATFVADSLQAETGLTATGPADSKITVTGEVPAGEQRTVTYQVTVKADADRGNNSLANFLFAGDETPEVCEPGDPCTVHPVPNLQVQKSVDPESGSTVEAGQTLSYTLTFDNATGTAPAAVDHRDDLGGVLDDASFLPDSLTADTGLTVAGPSDDALRITGSVPAGKTLTVRYQVEVLADGERGDNVLANFLLPPGITEPPVTCEVEDPSCTTNPVPEISYVKEVTASDDPIVAGKSTLSYTVTITNTGAATGKVDRTDDLSDVLDDATVVSQPVSDTDSVQVTEIADDAFTMNGTLAAGATATVTYTVRVKEAAAQGTAWP